jgi:hypothetical protein
MAKIETLENQSLEQFHEEYLAARKAFKQAEHKFGALVAGFKDLPAALNTKRDYIEITGPGVLAVNEPPAGPPWAQPATAPAKQIITRQEWWQIDEYVEALSDLKRKQEQAERLYAALPELDRQLGSRYRGPMEP